MFTRPRDAHDQFKRQVWAGAAPVRNLDPAAWRRDDSWNLMRYSDFGLEFSEYGWGVQHIVPLNAGGRAIASNCRAMHIRWILERTAGPGRR
jgi:hypothetical protein